MKFSDIFLFKRNAGRSNDNDIKLGENRERDGKLNSETNISSSVSVLNREVLAIIVLDESGSMDTIRSKTVSGLNEYIQSLQDQKESCYLTIVKFSSDGIRNVRNNILAKDAPLLAEGEYDPRGNTPLFDAIGTAIKNIEDQIMISKGDPDVLFIVITDGQENSSKNYRQQQIQGLISSKEKTGWTFVYLGANQDSWMSARDIGYMNPMNCANFQATDHGIEDGCKCLKESTKEYFRERADYYRRGNTARHYQCKKFCKMDDMDDSGGMNKRAC